MAEWSKNKVVATEINGGKEFTTDDVLTVAELNAMVNNAFYSVDFAEAMADAPDISEIDGEGVPNVSLIDNVKDDRVLKKLKFSNLRGQVGRGIYVSTDNANANTTLINLDTVINPSGNTISIGDMLLTATSKIFIITNISNKLCAVTLVADAKGEQGIRGKVGATFNYDASTKTLNIVTE